MKVTVTTLSDEIFSLDVSEDLELENFKAFCEVESGIPAREIAIVANGRPLMDNKKSLKDLGIRDGDVVILQHMQSSHSSSASSSATGLSLGSGTGISQLDFSGIQIPHGIAHQNSVSTPREEDPAYIRDIFMTNPDQLAILRQNNPRLADALLSGDLERFASVLREQQVARAQREEQRMRMVNADPFDLEAQRLIAEEIRQKNIEANMEAAMEYNPETFGTVAMLYVNCKVNGFPVKAFIDSGAQTTIMSAGCAERCHIMRLVDARWSGIAKGVGTQKIIGRIHMVQVQIEQDFLTTSFSVLQEQPMDMLLGLDMLKRHQCVIDLRRNVLVIGTTGTETNFLPENELPDCARLSSKSEEELLAESQLEAEDREMQQALEQSARETGTRRTRGDDTNISETSTAASTNKSDDNTEMLGESTSQIPAPRQIPASNPATSVLPTDRFSEADIRELQNLGFTREQVVSELRRFNGDKTQATAALFAKSLKF